MALSDLKESAVCIQLADADIGVKNIACRYKDRYCPYLLPLSHTAALVIALFV